MSALGPPADLDAFELAAAVVRHLMTGVVAGYEAEHDQGDIVVTDLETGARVRVTVTPVLRATPPPWDQLALDDA